MARAARPVAANGRDSGLSGSLSAPNGGKCRRSARPASHERLGRRGSADQAAGRVPGRSAARWLARRSSVAGRCRGSPGEPNDRDRRRMARSASHVAANGRDSGLPGSPSAPDRGKCQRSARPASHERTGDAYLAARRASVAGRCRGSPGAPNDGDRRRMARSASHVAANGRDSGLSGSPSAPNRGKCRRSARPASHGRQGRRRPGSAKSALVLEADLQLDQVLDDLPVLDAGR
jgi:hypothetical protein